VTGLVSVGVKRVDPAMMIAALIRSGCFRAGRRASCVPVSQCPTTIGRSMPSDAISASIAASAPLVNVWLPKLVPSGGDGGAAVPPNPGRVTAYMVNCAAPGAMNSARASPPKPRPGMRIMAWGPEPTFTKRPSVPGAAVL